MAAQDERASDRKSYLDGWRGLAILSVIVGHAYALPPINLGRFGVELFFILSGRLMAEILFEKQFPLSDFFARRFTRVWPTLAVFITVVYIAERSLPASVPLAVLTFTFNYARVFAEWNDDHVAHIWSLCVEEHGYLLLGIIAAVARRRSWSKTKLLCALGIIAFAMICNGWFRAGFLRQPHDEVYWLSDVRISSLLLPGIAYLARHRIISALGPYVRFASPTLLLAGTVMSTRIVPQSLRYSVGTCILSLAIVTLPQAAPTYRRLFEARWLVAVGIWSYSIYLWQQPIYGLAPYASWVRGLYGAAAIGAGYASWRFLENPTRAFLNRRWSVRRSLTSPLRGI